MTSSLIHSRETDVVLAADALSIRLEDGPPLVSDVDLQIRAGEVLGIVGESGSGKSTLSMGLLGYTQPGVVFGSGSIRLGEIDILTLPEKVRRRYRGTRIAYVPQDPPSAHNPSDRVRTVIERMLRAHGSIEGIREATETVLARVGLPTDAEFLSRYPHQLSGGQQQRLSIAAAIVCEPDIVVFDEPTTGLDPITTDLLLEEISRLRSEIHTAMVVVSHDITVIERIADRVIVLHQGRVVEAGSVRQVLEEPSHEYTRALLSAVPERAIGDPEAAAPLETGRVVFEAVDVRVSYGAGAKAREVLHGVNLRVGAGERVAIVGASGSGKSTLVRTIAGLAAPSGGEIRLDGEALGRDVRHRSASDLRRIQLVFQNPYSALNPRRTVAEIVAAGPRILERLPRAAARARALECLDLVELPRAFASRYPSELSGGQRQRVAIARSLATRPELLICDEVTSALDVQVQAKILAMLERLSDELSMAVLFVSHDLAVVSRFAHSVVVLSQGEILEQGPTPRVLNDPQAEYTQRLVRAAFPDLVRNPPL